MAKRSSLGPSKDDRPTIDNRAVAYLAPFLRTVRTFSEPCCGDGHLIGQLESYGLECVQRSDVKHGIDALDLTVEDLNGADVIISNFPWTRTKLHPLILKLMKLAPVWSLHSGDWLFNQGSEELIYHCKLVVPTCRLLWIPGTTTAGKDNTAWYYFDRHHQRGPKVIPRLKLKRERL